ncbi:MAG TPA: aspartate-semialdehyde dehydrogenase [Armatimonadota bacterium]
MKMKVAVVGATGIAGQQFLATLADHPLFEVTALAASGRSAGKPYIEALKDKNGSIGWWCEGMPSRDFQGMVVQDASRLEAADFSIVFTAIESDAARELEPKYAKTTPVISTASAFRMEQDVPLLIPGVNSGHAALLERQRKERGWKGFVVPIPNCTTTGLAVSLKPLQDAFGLERVLMTSMQAISGAGRNGGVLGLDITENVIPYIPGEEEKVQQETQKILGAFEGDHVHPTHFPVSATCTRVAVLDGHTEAVYLSTSRRASVEEAAEVLRGFDGGLSGLHSAPERMIRVTDDPFRPQPRRDREIDGGMCTVVGRLREDSALDNGLKYVLLSHNTKMGAAKGAVLVAELLHKEGQIR